jgi:voltage-gated potassium channel
MWWAIVSLTTVGYGDVVPIAPGGRVFTALVLLLDVGTVAVPSALLASSLVKRE